MNNNPLWELKEISSPEPDWQIIEFLTLVKSLWIDIEEISSTDIPKVF